jgi:hypothetical protein
MINIIQVNDQAPLMVNFHSTGAWGTFYTNPINVGSLVLAQCN